MTSFGQWSISKLSDTSRGLIKLCTLGLLGTQPPPWKNVQASSIKRGPKGKPCEMSYMDRDVPDKVPADLTQQKIKGKRASRSIHRIV